MGGHGFAEPDAEHGEEGEDGRAGAGAGQAGVDLTSEADPGLEVAADGIEDLGQGKTVALREHPGVGQPAKRLRDGGGGGPDPGERLVHVAVEASGSAPSIDTLKSAVAAVNLGQLQSMAK